MPPRKTLFGGTTSSDDEDHSVRLSHVRAPGRRQVKAPADRDAVLQLPLPKNAAPASSVPSISSQDTDVDAGAKAAGNAPLASPNAVTMEDAPDEDDARAREKDNLPPDSPRILEDVGDMGVATAAAASQSASHANPIEIGDSEDEESPPPPARHKNSRPIVVESGDEVEEPPKKKKKSKRKSKDKTSERADPTATDQDGILKDVSNSIDLADDLRDDRRDRTLDIHEHFSKVHAVKQGGVQRHVRDCLTCGRHRDAATHIVAEVTTLRRHLEAFHKETYLKWCKRNNFESKLPKDVRRRKNTARAAAEDALVQTSLDGHLVEKEKIVPYSDAAFREAALEWLIATDQPIAALEHPKFREMIAIAARAKDGVRIPSGYDSRKAILRAFRSYLSDLKQRLESPSVKGKVSTTCDAWTSIPGDSYFAVTGHWVEETGAGTWELKSALLGFTHMPYAHNGRRLGQALFKILDRLGIAEKLGWVTCDNATNMNSMMRELQVHMHLRGVTEFDARKRRIRCLAHVINLGTQAFLKAHDDPQNRPEGMRNSIELVREIAIKEQSSSQRRQGFVDIQAAAGVLHPVHLMKDMPVRWSSTKNMLKRAYENRVHISQLVTELERAEKNWRKRGAISALHVSDGEWAHVKLLLELLQIPDCAQQAFSAESYSTLYNAVPALLSLCRAWEARMNDAHYVDLWDCLAPAVGKLREYVDDIQASLNNAYYMSMALHPSIKLGPVFNACWPDSDNKINDVERMFCERYEKLNSSPQSAAPAKPKAGALRSLLAELQPSTSTAAEATPSSEIWRIEFDSYLRSDHDIPDGMSLVRWWGMNSTRYPTWASLAADCMGAMASSVSSERVFSSAGITITKRRNRLQADIVEALQVLKVAIRNDLLVRAPAPSSTLEEILEENEERESMAAFGDGSGDAQVAAARADMLETLTLAVQFSDSESVSSDDEM